MGVTEEESQSEVNDRPESGGEGAKQADRERGREVQGFVYREGGGSGTGEEVLSLAITRQQAVTTSRR